MPYETVQHAVAGEPNPTETVVVWTKNSHVQLRVERYDLADPRPVIQGEAVAMNMELQTFEPPPPVQADPIPVGSIRASFDGHIARKDDDGAWNIWRREGDMEVVTEIQIQDWPVIWKPEGGAVAAEIYTDVLSRSAINRMIRVLRQARDAAYGADA